MAFSNAALHWIVDQKAVLAGVQRSLKSGGRLLFQMAGKGNAKDVLNIIQETKRIWSLGKNIFHKMPFPYGFYDPEEYRAFLRDADLVAERVEFFPKDMKLKAQKA